MAFVAGRIVALAGAGSAPLPSGTDVSGYNPGFTLYSHMRVPTGPVTITFDTGQAYAVVGDTIIPIPASALSFAASGATNVQLGKA